MIQASTILNVADNSGAKKVNCIRILGGYKKKTASIGDVIIASIREMRRQGPGQIWKVKKGDVVKCLIIRTKKSNRTSSGFSYSASDNAVVLLDTNNNPIGNRVLGPVTEKLKKSGFGKIINMSSLSAF
jgi:large subunit ribosomal protein L14